MMNEFRNKLFGTYRSENFCGNMVVFIYVWKERRLSGCKRER